MFVKLFSIILITYFFGIQSINCDENTERIIEKINNCVLFYHGGTDKDSTDGAMHEIYNRVQGKMNISVENLCKDVRETGKIDTKINTDAMLYDILYSEVKASNITEFLKDKVNIEANIDDTSREMVYSVIEKIVTGIEQCLINMKKAFESRTVDICMDRTNTEELEEIKKVAVNCHMQYKNVLEECRTKLKGIGKTENEIEYIVSIIQNETL